MDYAATDHAGDCIMSSVASISPNNSNESSLQERLADPNVARGLNRLLDRLDTVTFAIEAMEGFVARGDTIADSVAAAVGEFKNASSGQGGEWLSEAPQMVETSRRLMGSAKKINTAEVDRSEVLDKLTQPETLALLNDLIERLPLIAMMVDSMEGFIKRGDTIADNVAGMVKELKLSDKKFDVAQIASTLESLPKLKEAGEQFLNSGLADGGLPKVIDAGVSMIESGMMDKDVVATLGYLGKVSVETYHEVTEQNVQPVGGVFALMRATKDPDVQKSIGFFFAFAKAFAKHLK
ncbi:MAG: DUF1641 domain-containing protein [Pirellulaceae bacterium]